jgi:hypothetical protein
VTSVKDQLNCGSGWAFAAVAAMESMYLIDNSQKSSASIDLSEQALLDCDTTQGGCDGGWPYDVLRHPKGFAVKKGITYEKSNPYKGDVQSNCRNPTPKLYNKYLGPYDESSIDGNEDELQYLLQDGPVVVGFYVTDSFAYYESGIYDDDDDSCSGDGINHFRKFVT